MLKKALLAALLLPACDEKKTSGPAAAAVPQEAVAAASGTQVASLPISVDVPEGAEANGGAPGFHSEDGSVYVLIKAAAATDPQDLEAAKTAASEIGFTKWVKSEKTADGWSLVWNGTGMDMDGKEYETTAYSVRKKVGAASYDCYGSVKNGTFVEKNLKLCQSLKRSPSNVRRVKTYAKPSLEELKQKLTPEQFKVACESGTEPPFKNAYWDNHAAGLYVDATTGEPLFSSTDKFDSGSGWPAFTQPVQKQVVVEKKDVTHGMTRIEVRSKSGDAHLGHVFDDGPSAQGGLRYCINSASLRFVPVDRLEAEGYGEYTKLFDDAAKWCPTVAGARVSAVSNAHG